MGDGQQPQEPELPANAPADLRDFVSCKSATLTLKDGKVTWISIKPRDLLSADVAQYVPDAVLDTSASPSMTITPDPSAPGTASVRVGIEVPGLGTVGPSFTASIKDGTLNVDSSGMPAAAKGPVDDAVKNLNDWLKANRKGFGAPAFGKGDVKLSKVDIAAPKTAPSPTPVPTPQPTKPEPLKAGPGKGTPGGPGATPPGTSGLGPVGSVQAAGTATATEIERLTKARNDAYAEMERAAKEFDAINAQMDTAKEAGIPIDPDGQRRFDEARKRLGTTSNQARQAELALEKACREANVPVPPLPGAPQIPIERKSLGRADTAPFEGQTAGLSLVSFPAVPTGATPETEATTPGTGEAGRSEPPPEPAGYHIFPVNEPPPLDGAAVAAAQERRFPTVQVAVGGAIVLGAIVIGGLVLANNQGGAGPGTSPTPSQVAQGATPAAIGASSPSASPGTASNAVPTELQALASEITLDTSTVQQLPSWWMTDPTGDLQDVAGGPAEYAPPFADITGWVALEDDAVKPGALAGLAADCGKTVNGFQFICGTKTVQAIQANPTAAVLAITTFGAPFPQGFPQRATTPCGNQICSFVVQLVVDRDGSAANNSQAPPGQPNNGLAGADGAYFYEPMTTPQGGSVMRLISLDLSAHKTAETSAFMVMGQQMVAYVLFDLPKQLRVTDQAGMFAGSSSGGTTSSQSAKLGLDVWGAFPPMNFTPQKAPLFWGRSY